MTDNSNAVCRIYARCTEVGECLEWTGPVSKAGGIYVSVRNIKKLARRVLWEDKRGPIPKGKQVTCTCDNPRCMRHLKLITISQKNRRTGAAGWWSSPAQRAKIAAGWQHRLKLTDEQVEEIRSSTESAPKIAPLYGVSAGYVNALRRGKWRRKSNPFAWLMAANDSMRRAA